MDPKEQKPEPAAPAKGYSKGYGKRPIWQWVVIYVVVAAIVYFLIYWFFFHHSGTGTNSLY